MPKRAAASFASTTCGGFAGLPSLNNAPTRWSPGSASWQISSRLPISSLLNKDRPVMLPPGRARLATSPSPTASMLAAMTIGIVDVASFAAFVAGNNAVTMTSGLRRTNSAASAGSRSGLPLGPAVLDGEVLALDIAEFVQAAQKSLVELRRTRPLEEIADKWSP